MSLFSVANDLPSRSKKTLAEIPVVFLSFDEPNADLHWELLKKVTPHDNIARVHGVKGFDACHKAAADSFPKSDYVITVDADNQVDSDFYKQRMPDGMDGRVSFTWGGRQYTNGLMYGNGGLKLWSTEHLANMRSHELATAERDAVDFCWDFTRYKELPGCYSTAYTNGSPYQAFRVGFREGVKLSMEQGRVLGFSEWSTTMHAANFQRLMTWMTIGRDVEHGIWSIYGARLAVKMLQYDNFDFTNIRDYDWFNDFFNLHTNANPVKATKALGKRISEGLGWDLPDFDNEQSYFLKMLQLHPAKSLTYEDVKWRTNLKMYGWFNE
jgi:hypothetical protein